MDELEKTTPDDFWRKAFEEATETPPPRVWNAIEHQLNETAGGRIIPLWAAGLLSSRPVAWSMGIAASLTLLLAGWWLLSTPINTQVHKVAARVAEKEHTSISLRSPARVPPSSSGQVVATVDLAKRAVAGRGVEAGTLHKANLYESTSLVNTEPASSHKPRAAHQPFTLDLAHQSIATVDVESAPLSNARFVSAPFTRRVSLVKSLSVEQAFPHVVFEPVTGRSAVYSARFNKIHRIVWFQPTESLSAPEAVKAKRKNRDVWASAIIMPGLYNPMVSLQTASVAQNYALYNTSTNSQQTNDSKQLVSSQPNFSVAYQASAGVQLNDRWSVESGVGYLSGRSTIETPAQLPATALVALTSRVGSTSTLYADVIRNNAAADQLAVSPGAYVSNQIGYYSQNRQALTNNYQFVQVPVQVGYQLRPRKRLSLALLGGLITNIFVRNTVGDDLVVTAKDGIYRPISLAATMGARVRYRPSRQWSASLAGIYQPSFSVGTSSESQVQTRPTAAGMSLGVDYHF